MPACQSHHKFLNILQPRFHTIYKPLDGGPSNSSKDEEEARVPSGPTTRSRAKAVKEHICSRQVEELNIHQERRAKMSYEYPSD